MAFYPLDARRPTDLVRTNITLRNLYAQARSIERLQSLVETQLEPAAREHCKVASFADGVLRFVVSSSHWATRLRYQQKRLVRQLQAYKEFATLTKIHCKVHPPLVKKAPPVRTMRRSAVAAEHLQETAEQVTDATLRAALEKLARHHSGVQ
ncbi:MAG: DciA family protein [Halopseudomonas sp.]|uniref:DUF721 domain-containing protein n=1 Tax=Halopseudomonas sp. TaxID=2901191 RepID=UPI0030018454